MAELQEMFENLLVSSMDSQTATDAHPAFVSIISQLEANIAKLEAVWMKLEKSSYLFRKFVERYANQRRFAPLSSLN